MTANEPVAIEAYNPGDDATPAPWAEAVTRLEKPDKAATFWLATVSPDGGPHVVPLLVVWAEGALHFSASPDTRKAGNLMDNAQCVITTSSDPLDLVIEGRATKVTDDTRLHGVAEAYASRYGWHVEVREGAFHAEGAPTAGPPPYEVYEVTPTVAFGFPWDDSFTPTRWRF